MRKGLFLLVMLVTLVGFVSCDEGDDDKDYSIDIPRLKTTVPGTWIIGSIEVRESNNGTSALPDVNTALMNAAVRFADGGYRTVNAEGELCDEGTYSISPYKFVLTHTTGKKDTLEIANVDRDNYIKLSLKKNFPNRSSVVYHMEKVINE